MTRKDKDSSMSDNDSPNPADALWMMVMAATEDVPTIHFDIRPKSKARPRVTRRGITYMPKDYVLYCKRLAEVFHAAGGETLTGDETSPLVMVMEFGLKVPQMLNKTKLRAVERKALLGTVANCSRADVDNLEGAVLDALLPKDVGGDGRVVMTVSRKIWSASYYVKLKVMTC